MADVDAALSQAVARHQSGDLAAAERAYRAILAEHPDHADARHLLGLVHFQNGDTVTASTEIRRAIELDRRAPMYHANLGRVLMAQGLPGEAVAAYREAVALTPEDAAVHSDMAAALVALEDHDAARSRARLALELDPTLAAAHLNLGQALLGGGGPGSAEAEACFRRAADLNPALADAHQALGQILQARGENDAAMDCYRMAIQAQPGMVEAHCNLGNILRDRMDLTAALVQYDAALATAPDAAAVHGNKGVALHEMGRFDEALASYDRALELNPDDADTARNRAMTLLLLGRFKEGWAEYEARWRTPRFKTQARHRDKPRWSPATAVSGATVLVQAEQGLGDTIQFARYVGLLAEREQQVIFDCPAPLMRLMASLDGAARVIEQGQGRPPHHDFQVPLMSLPGILGTELEAIPADVPYLNPGAPLVGIWRRRLAEYSGPRIGVVWKGSPDHVRDRVRSPGLAPLLPLLELKGATFVSLQKGGDKDLRAHGPDNVVDLSDELMDFADTAAVMQNLDLVVSCDTAVGHLAGALGRPVAMLLPHVAEWRWLLAREDTPWYPTMRLFRQPTAGNWAGAVENLIAHVRRHWL